MESKFGIITISHKRTKVLELFCASIERIRNNFGNIPVVCVGDEEHKPICEKYNIHHITQQNRPTTYKWNTGVKYLLTQNIDYIMITGSDDIISNETIETIGNSMDQNFDFIYTHQIYFYSNESGGKLLKLVAKQIIGVCRTVHRRVWEKKDDLWWPISANHGMDGIFYREMSKYIKTKKEINGVIVDVKSKDSLNKFALWKRKIKIESDVDEFYDILSEKEKQILKEI